MANINNIQDEQNALRYILGSKDPEMLNRITLDHFGTRDFQNIFRLVRMFYAEHGSMIGWDALAAEIDRRVNNTDKARFLIDTLGDIKSRDLSGLSAEILLKNLEGNRKLRAMLGHTDTLLAGVESRDVDRSVAALQEMYSSVFQDTTASSLVDNDMVNLAGKTVKFNFRETGIGGIDRRGGLIEGGYTLIGAVAKAGKSTLAAQMAVHNHDNYEGSTAYFSFEQGKEELRARILSSRASLDLGMIMNDMLTPEEWLLLREAEVKHLCNWDENMRDYCAQTASETTEEFWPAFWNHFQPRDNRFYLMDNSPDWDELFVQMDLLATTKNVKMFVVDYPFLVTRGAADRTMSGWEYNLLQSKKLKRFARRHQAYMVTPAQYDADADSLKFVKNVVNDCDLFLALTQEEGDADMQPGGAVTCSFKAYRNFLSIADEPQLQPFKMMREFAYSRFRYFSF